MYRLLAVSTAAALLAFAPANASEFQATQTIEKVITTENPDGTVSVDLVDAARVKPGETLLYRLDYNNGTSAPAENISLVMPVPNEVIYTENSAASGDVSATISFSTDGGQSFAPRGELLVTTAGEPRQAVAEDITHILWAFDAPLQAGAMGAITYEAIVR